MSMVIGVEETLELLSLAVEANLQTVNRQGNLISLDAEDGDEVMITADLHGHQANCERILEIADLEHHPKRHLIMQEVCHGGPSYAGNIGCQSHLMLREMAFLKVKYGSRFHFLMSNHELAELTDYPISKDGKMVTLSFRLGIAQEFGDDSETIHQAYMSFVGSCPLAIRINENIFVCHSAPEEVDSQGFDVNVFERPLTAEDLDKHGDAFRLVWGRDYRQENADKFAELVKADVLIHGHTPCEKGFNVPNDKQIILDCCATPASYVILPLNEELTHEQVVDKIQLL